jgi:UDP-hydrolysing UDP-N-acetyl-D-glucosamine 2-epimerase
MSGSDTPRRRVMVVTGSRAEFGLLEPVMRAVAAHTSLELQVVVAGSHLLGPAETWRDVHAAGFEIAARVAMQREGLSGRFADALAVARGIDGVTRAVMELAPAWVVVLGDRVEAFAAASAASIAGVAVAHIHGGDRAEGVADEAMRHAITKLAHLHLAATPTSAQRIVRMGERAEHVHVVGSPSMDGLRDVRAMQDGDAAELGDPSAMLLLHPAGLSEAHERGTADACLRALENERSVLAMMPNCDPGREWIADEIARAPTHIRTCDHLPRARFAALLKRLGERGGVLVGNSSAGLIEAAALGVPVVNVGPRQAGRERPDNVIDVEPMGGAVPTAQRVREAMRAACALDRSGFSHPYGDGHSGPRIADLLARVDALDPGLLRKRNSY